MAIRVCCDTPGCNETDMTSAMTTLQEGDFCHDCMEGQRFTNDCIMARRGVTPAQEWAEIQSDRYDAYMNEY